MKLLISLKGRPIERILLFHLTSLVLIYDIYLLVENDKLTAIINIL